MRISATWLDAYALYQDTDWMSEAKLIAQIRGSDPMSEKALTGIRMHKLLQGQGGGVENGAYVVEGERFSEEDFSRVIKRHSGHTIVSEVRMEKTVHINGEDHLLVGKTDGGHGRVAMEFKAKIESPIDLESYFHARQPFLYLWMGGWDRIDYEVYSLKDEKGTWRIADERLFTLFPYHHMEQDCLSWLREFMEWARGKDLTRVA